MIKRIIRFSAGNRILVIAVTLVLLAVSVWSMKTIPLDALRPPGLPVFDAGLDPRMAAPSFVIAVLAALVFAIAPTTKPRFRVL